MPINPRTVWADPMARAGLRLLPIRRAPNQQLWPDELHGLVFSQIADAPLEGFAVVDIPEGFGRGITCRATWRGRSREVEDLYVPGWAIQHLDGSLLATEQWEVPKLLPQGGSLTVDLSIWVV